MDQGEGFDSRLFEAVSREFVEALRRSLNVAGLDEAGEPKDMSQTALATRSGISRSTLAKYLGTGQDEAAANPTLEVICRLADTLGVPPAFLLMRPKDWASIARGADHFIGAVQNPAAKHLLFTLSAKTSLGSGEVARAAVELGRILQTVEDVSDPLLTEEVREFRKATKTSTATVAASIPFRHDGVSISHLPVLLCLCGLVGVSTARN